MVKNRSSKAKIAGTKQKVNPVPRSTTKTPLAINTKTRNVAPKVSSSGNGTVVSHREILSDNVTVSPTYSISSTVAVQPAISVYSRGSPLGTWLPKIAQEYDNYCFESLKVHFTTSASSLQKGTILMAYDPNPDSAAPATFSDLRNMAYAVTGPCRENLTLDLSSIVKQKKLLTRTRAVNAYPLYDAGRIFLGSTLGDSASVGYFEVEYKVRLMNPQTSPSTDIVNSSAAPPALVFTDINATGGNLWFGTANGNRCANGFTNALCRLGGFGDTSLITMNNPLSIYTTSGSVVVSGITYSWAQNSNNSYFTFAFPGRYRVTATLNGDWQDYCTFGASILKATTTGLSEAFDRTLTTSGAVADVPLVPASWRGFTVPNVTGGDLAGLVDITFAVPDTTQGYTLAVGIRNNTAITENGTGAYASNPTVYGASVLRIEYLGPLPQA